jgi:hypothetical protein
MGFFLLGFAFYPISCCAKLIYLIRSYLLYSVDVQIAYHASLSLSTHVIHLSYRMILESKKVLGICMIEVNHSLERSRQIAIGE